MRQTRVKTKRAPVGNWRLRIGQFRISASEMRPVASGLSVQAQSWTGRAVSIAGGGPVE